MTQRRAVSPFGFCLSLLLAGGMSSSLIAQELPLPDEYESVYTPGTWQPDSSYVPASQELPVSSMPSACAPTDSCTPADSCAPTTCEPAPTGCGACGTSPWMTGDWGGLRTNMAESGITTLFDETLFYFGVPHGGFDQDFDFSGHGDYVMNFDMGKLGGQEGLFLKIRGEHRYGETINQNTGAFLPATLSPELPVRDHVDLYVTNFLFTQALSENFAVFAGKLDTLDGDANAFAHGRGKTQFSNLAFIVNPALLGTAPYSTLATGFSILHEMQPIFTFSVLNPTDTTRTTGFSELFSEGVLLTSELRLPTQFFGLPGHQTVGGLWNSRDFISLGQDPRIILPEVPIARQAGSWGMYYNFDQHLTTYSDESTAGWGVFGRYGVTDDRTNPIAHFYSFGVGGNSPWRQQDTFGIGWYRADISDNIGPFLPALLGPLGDGQGVELFYNIEVTPWLRLTPDVQFLDPSRQNVDDSIVCGLRGQFIL